jgi:predicted deacylase
MFGFPHEFKRNMTNKITNRLLRNLMARVLDMHPKGLGLNLHRCHVWCDNVYGHNVCHTIQCTLMVSTYALLKI